MNQESKPHNSFSLIADFDIDINSLGCPEGENELPILPLRDLVIFPGIVTTVSIGRDISRALIREVELDEDGFFVAMTQVDPEVEHPQLEDLYPTGVIAKLLRVIDLPGEGTTAIIHAVGRAALTDGEVQTAPFMSATFTTLEKDYPDIEAPEFVALCEQIREAGTQYLRLRDASGGIEAQTALRQMGNSLFFLNFVAFNLLSDTEEKALLLMDENFTERTYRLLRLLNREVRLLTLKHEIQERTNQEIDRQQKEYFLQQQIKNLRGELGEDESKESEALRARAESLPLPPAVRSIFDKELRKLDRLNLGSPDYGVILTYLDTILSLPWGTVTPDIGDLRRARHILDRDHYGMDDVKERVIEHLAMMSARATHRPEILCLVGPPGVGKTSLCRSIAECLGRNYVRVSLGGLHDESEIRGHRRTYIGAMCGRIMKSVVKAGTDNPLFVLDEIDKISGDNYHGDPRSAMLELLDPEQNSTFHDNYLDFDYDLSRVFFIATANSLSSIPQALLDRMEVIRVDGYLTEEKKEIMRRHLIPKATQGLSKDFSLKFTSGGSEFLIDRYTRESGVRQLAKCLDKIVRKEVVRRLESPARDAAPEKKGALRPADVERIMGKPLFTRDSYEGNDFAGVVTALAWTPVGGEILFVESSLTPAKNSPLTLTGNLGDTMRESASIAYQYVKSHAELLGIDSRIFEAWRLHIHVPDGSTPKDGPSAGITIATSIASVFTQRKVRARLAMTGEITLRGKVLPVGGIKEKILAAKRAGIKDVVLSKINERDISEIPDRYLKGLNFHYVDTVEEVWQIALLDEKVAHPLRLLTPIKESAHHESQ